MPIPICTPRCGPNQSSQLPDNWTPPPSGGGLPEGGEIGQVVVNTGPGEGEWQDPPAALPSGGTIGQVVTNTGPGAGTWQDPVAGPEGPEGPMGPAGPTGPAGADGAPGADGADGANGLQGPAGIEGPEGPQGPAGATGATGAQGIPGVQGASLTIDDYGILDEATVTAIETADVDWWFLVDPGGDDRVNQSLPAGIAGDMERHLIVYRASDNSWSDYGQFTGIQGPAGPTGATGAPGVAGPAGPTGPQGVPGSTGPAGATGATGPAGATGPTGPTGLTGPAGATGPAGPTGPAGISAYQSALNGGFVGTEAQWIASLEGTPATTQPTFDVVLLNDTAVPAGTYPLTIYQPIPYTFTKLTHRTAQGTVTNLRLRKNGTIVATVASVTTTRVTTAISVAVVVGDILELELTTVTGVRRFDAALS